MILNILALDYSKFSENGCERNCSGNGQCDNDT